MPYKFAWAVKDEPSKNDYSHQQESDGKVVTGSYRVALPDGRTQIVTYTADENGYRAEVKYEGEASYPVYQRPASYAATPAAYPSTQESYSASPVPTPSNTYSSESYSTSETYSSTTEAAAEYKQD